MNVLIIKAVTSGKRQFKIHPLGPIIVILYPNVQNQSKTGASSNAAIPFVWLLDKLNTHFLMKCIFCIFIAFLLSIYYCFPVCLERLLRLLASWLLRFLAFRLLGFLGNMLQILRRQQGKYEQP
jgi:hypothetical protein